MHPAFAGKVGLTAGTSLFFGSIAELQDLGYLTPAEQARWEKMPSRKRQREFCAGRNLLQRALGQYCVGYHSVQSSSGPLFSFAYNQQQQLVLQNAPFVNKPSIHISLSHAGEWVAAAVCMGHSLNEILDEPSNVIASEQTLPATLLGLDIEFVRRHTAKQLNPNGSSRALTKLHKIAQFAFAKEEWQELIALSERQQANYFYRLWALKEAWKKATALPFFTVSRQCTFISRATMPAKYHIITGGFASTYLCALVAPAATADCYCWHGPQQQFVPFPLTSPQLWEVGGIWGCRN